MKKYVQNVPKESNPLQPRIMKLLNRKPTVLPLHQLTSEDNNDLIKLIIHLVTQPLQVLLLPLRVHNVIKTVIIITYNVDHLQQLHLIAIMIALL